MKLAPLVVCAFLTVAGLLPVFAADATGAPATDKPDIIFILADDLGIGGLSCYGGDHFSTPNIDKLAASGIRFQHCYSAPLCGPARALLLTGRYAFRTGMTANTAGDLMKPANEIMIPTMLKPAGYVTGSVGKWEQMPLQPSDWGFDEYLRFEGSGKYWNTQKDNKTYTVNGKTVPLLDGEYLPDKMNDFATDFITRHKDQPFFLYYPMSHVHGQWLPTPDSPKGTRTKNQIYQDNISYMDKLVGELVDTVDKLNLRKKTLILFMGDNGTPAPFKEFCTVDGKQISGCKNTMLECGALVPMIVSWPGTTPGKQVSANFINSVDFYPTMAQVAGTALPKGVKIDGQPFTPMLHGQNTGDWVRDWIFVLLRKHWYDRETDWKLNEAGELYDMKNAPFEETLVSESSKDPDALTARQHLQGILNTLNPAGGIRFKPPADGGKKNKKKNSDDDGDSENMNAPDQ